ncbi:hypothetical protein CEXT_459781, partial [Caerostris extrusa]
RIVLTEAYVDCIPSRGVPLLKSTPNKLITPQTCLKIERPMMPKGSSFHPIMGEEAYVITASVGRENSGLGKFNITESFGRTALCRNRAL